MEDSDNTQAEARKTTVVNTLHGSTELPQGPKFDDETPAAVSDTDPAPPGLVPNADPRPLQPLVSQGSPVFVLQMDGGIVKRRFGLVVEINSDKTLEVCSFEPKRQPVSHSSVPFFHDSETPVYPSWIGFFERDPMDDSE